MPLEIFNRKPQQVELDLGPVKVKVKDAKSLIGIPLQNIEINLKLAESEGVRPLNFREISSQLKRGEDGKSVFFDTPPVPGFIGNHWRLVSKNSSDKTIELQHCGNFGSYDHEQISPIEVSEDTPMFTGVSVQNFEMDGKQVTFEEISRVMNRSKSSDTFEYPENLSLVEEKTLWSDSSGKLLPSRKHPLRLR